MRLLSEGFAGDPIGFWAMFQAGAEWIAVRADSAQLRFTNGFSFVTYDLGVHGDTLRGTAHILFDFGNPDSMPHGYATGLPCR
jgi:hypothetical protein